MNAYKCVGMLVECAFYVFACVLSLHMKVFVSVDVCAFVLRLCGLVLLSVYVCVYGCSFVGMCVCMCVYRTVAFVSRA